ncbi:MAG: D-tyrosyl-tRNA(Tyr) deacylase [Dehalococcoidia bacterium]|nr:MAG: D-tyrosyl-tRNA(Tyr) deacylase [Dehalococcoidia bacterium]
MKALLQRVTSGAVAVEGAVVGRIGPGLVVFLGVGRKDVEEDADYLAQKVACLRVFPREDAEFDLSVQDTGGGVLVVSQFTLMADTRKGRRPSFIDAAPPEMALPLYERFVAALSAQGLTVATGVFQAYMHVELVNDGPVTVLLESRRRQ